MVSIYSQSCTIVFMSVIGHSDHVVDWTNYNASVPCDSCGKSQLYNSKHWMNGCHSFKKKKKALLRTVITVLSKSVCKKKLTTP